MPLVSRRLQAHSFKAMAGAAAAFVDGGATYIEKLGDLGIGMTFAVEHARDSLHACHQYESLIKVPRNGSVAIP